MLLSSLKEKCWNSSQRYEWEMKNETREQAAFNCKMWKNIVNLSAPIFDFQCQCMRWLLFVRLPGCPLLSHCYPLCTVIYTKAKQDTKVYSREFFFFFHLTFLFNSRTMIWNRTINILLSASNFHSIELPWLRFSVSF